jgi:hypothetical protein
MDVRLYFRVLWRFRVLVAAGFLLAFALAFTSLFSVSFKRGLTVSYRQHEIWKADETLLVTQSGFPWGRAIFPQPLKNGQPAASPFADTGRFVDLAVFYSQLANSDQVQALVLKSGPLNGVYNASPVVDTSGPQSLSLPIFAIEAQAISPAGAVRIARRVSTAFKRYITQQQAVASIPVSQRVVISTVSAAQKAKIAQKRKLTSPIIVFLAVLVGTLGLAFILENLRPRLDEISVGIDEEAEVEAVEPPSPTIRVPRTATVGFDREADVESAAPPIRVPRTATVGFDQEADEEGVEPIQVPRTASGMLDQEADEEGVEPIQVPRTASGGNKSGGNKSVARKVPSRGGEGARRRSSA